MSGKEGRASLFITLGIAAIDMLTCAFVSAIVLFFLFLVPKHAAGGSDSQDLLFLHWSALGSTGAVIGITLERDGRRSTIWSDDPQRAQEVCPDLSRTPDITDACYILNSGNDSSDQDGVLMINRPKTGQWSVAMTYGDTSDNGNGGNYHPVELRVTLVGDGAIDLVAQVAAGGQIDLATIDKQQTETVRRLLKIAQPD